MLEIQRVDHIGQVVVDLNLQVTLLTSLFGFKPEQRWENPKDGIHGMMLAIPQSAARWEVLAPISGDSALHHFLDSPRGPGIHHVAMGVSDIDAARQELRKLGIDSGPTSAGSSDVIIDPDRDGNGLLFRLFGPKVASACNGGTAADSKTATAGDPDAGATPMGIVGIDHVCHVCPDRDALRDWYERVFGMHEIFRTPPGENPDLADLVLEIPYGEKLRWEVLQPVGEESFVQRFLDKRGSGPHHATFQVGDWQHAVEALEQYEIPYFDENQGETDGARWRDAFIHPRYTGGVLVQFFWEERPDIWVRSDKVPSGQQAR